MYKMLGMGEAKLKVRTHLQYPPPPLTCDFRITLVIHPSNINLSYVIPKETLELAGHSVVEMMKPYSIQLMGMYVLTTIYLNNQPFTVV